MTHSVEQHLEVTPEAYDVQIRRFVPGYDAMLDEVVGALAEHLPGGRGSSAHVIDLGAGTGALAARIAAAFPSARLTVLDIDPEMLALAAGRLAALQTHGRVELVRGSFAERLPPCDAAVASLSLHHVHDRDAKRDVYRNVLAALPAGALFVNADATVPAAAALAEPLRRRWAAHLVASGDTEAQAYERFAQWATEDRYLGVDEELDLLREAGFAQVDVRWRVGPTSVIVARQG